MDTRRRLCGLDIFTVAKASGEGIVTFGVCVYVCVCLSVRRAATAGATLITVAVHRDTTAGASVSLCGEGHALYYENATHQLRLFIKNCKQFI